MSIATYVVRIYECIHILWLISSYASVIVKFIDVQRALFQLASLSLSLSSPFSFASKITNYLYQLRFVYQNSP